MFYHLARKLFGTENDRFLKGVEPIISQINALEPSIEALNDAELKGQTDAFRKALAAGKTLDDILPEAFATVREAAKRTLGQRHYDVQLIGGITLHRGMIAEMRTGEGKTLVSTLAAYLNAISGKGVHLVTVNDYLAKRDSEWMRCIYEALGLSIGCILHNMSDLERKEAYAKDITYGTNNEFGFDYLRDNMKFSIEDMVQREFNFAIVDEVDSILIDEARTPLIISGPTEDNTDLYLKTNTIIPQLSEDDYDLDEKNKSVAFTDEGTEKVEQLLKDKGLIPEEGSLYDIESVSLVHHTNQALRAHKLFTKDVDYIVKDDKIVIIDEFTGRMMEGRRFSEGLHQALEAREGVTIQNENQTLASITFQNYFRMFPKLAGMTGTAMTEATEFHEIYKLNVVDVPTHLPVARADHDDEIYRTAEEKYEAVITLIEECYSRKQPVLIGTVSIEKSETIAKILKKKKIPHNVLNAKFHEQEAHIIAQAGRPAAVTIATNMAGRGTDIMLGGNPDMLIADSNGKIDEATIRAQVEQDKELVKKAGGLYVIATERHESRRIDNQLRGRSGRQGDPGATKFFLSLEDDLMRIFGSDRIKGMLEKLGLEEGEAITHPWINKALEKAQQRVEGRNYEIRKNLLKFDDVMNDQRKVIYEQRIDLMQSEDVRDTIADMQEEICEQAVIVHIPAKSYAEEWDTEGLEKEIHRIYGLSLPIAEWGKEEGIADQEILERIQKEVLTLWKEKEEKYGEELLRMAEKQLLLFSLDHLWKDHLLSLDHLRQGISLRAFGQKDPLNEYKREAFHMFEQMLNHLRDLVVSRLFHMEINLTPEDSSSAENMFRRSEQRMHEGRTDPALVGAGAETQGNLQGQASTLRNHVAAENRDPTNPATWGKISRNEPCPCGSSKKYKHCHGQI